MLFRSAWGARAGRAGRDPADLDFPPLDRPWEPGRKGHPAVAVGTAGVPLGLLHQSIRARDPAEVGIDDRVALPRRRVVLSAGS